MPSFCNQGDTATVTFPSGLVTSYSDTPINITCVDEYNDCSLYGITFKVTTVTPGYGSSTNQYTVYCRGSKDSPFAIRINGLKVEIYCRGASNQCVSLLWLQVLSVGAFTGRYLENAVILNIFPDTGTPAVKKRIKIIGLSGATLHTALYVSCNYSVVCAPTCPQNTLDCGDCCLDCLTIFNGIADIRRLIMRIV